MAVEHNDDDDYLKYLEETRPRKLYREGLLTVEFNISSFVLVLRSGCGLLCFVVILLLPIIYVNSFNCSC